ncbi:hypothetical protein HD806DRAFT_528770 [Xylariaceae sp. AK1471]|nr:hypothetical protein HD806DRAFT_528770 [Xylariaceae sp. AK1471]
MTGSMAALKADVEAAVATTVSQVRKDQQDIRKDQQKIYDRVARQHTAVTRMESKFEEQNQDHAAAVVAIRQEHAANSDLLMKGYLLMVVALLLAGVAAWRLYRG